MADPLRTRGIADVGALRRALGVTQQELATLLGVSSVTVSRWERGVSTPTRRIRLRLDELAQQSHGPSSGRTTVAGVLRTSLAPSRSFVGRDTELAATRQALERDRLVTLVGPGGVGKTRLAAESVGEVSSVAFVDLSPLSARDTIADAVRMAIEAAADSARADAPLWEAAEAVQVIVLDNCEHVIDAVRTLLLERPARQRRPVVLATSRSPIGVAGEQVLEVMPLPVGGPESAGVALFRDRAELADPAFRSSPGDDDVIAELCALVDGLPLGIELMATQCRVLTPLQIRDRLLSAVSLRTREGLGGRHRSLDHAIAWGFELLDHGTRDLFIRLGVFPGSFDIDAVEAIAAGEAESVERLATLARHSLLIVANDARTRRKRYRMLDTIRRHAAARLAESGYGEEIRALHAEHFESLVQGANEQLGGPQQRVWLDRIDVEIDNVRLALAHAIDRDDAATSLRFCVALWRYWSIRARSAEGRAWFERALVRVGEVAPAERAEAFNAAGNLAQDVADHEAAARLYRAARSAFEASNNPAGQARALSNLGIVASMQGDLDEALSLLTRGLALLESLSEPRLTANLLHNLAVVHEHRGELNAAEQHYVRSREIFGELNDDGAMATVLNNLGNLLRADGKFVRARALYSEALERRRRLGDIYGIASCLHNLGVIARLEDQLVLALDLLEQSLAMSREAGNTHGAANTLAQLGALALSAGDVDRAVDRYIESLLIRERLRERAGLAESFEGLAAACARTDPVRAARLIGAAMRLRDAAGEAIVDASVRDELDRTVSEIRRRLGYEHSEAELQNGRAWTLLEAIEAALRVITGASHATRHRVASTRPRLSERQVEVIGWVARGDSNAAIADRLGVSKRTVESHLAAIYTVLGVSNRAEAIAYALGVAVPRSRA